MHLEAWDRGAAEGLCGCGVGRCPEEWVRERPAWEHLEADLISEVKHRRVEKANSLHRSEAGGCETLLWHLLLAS